VEGGGGRLGWIYVVTFIAFSLLSELGEVDGIFTM